MWHSPAGMLPLRPIFLVVFFRVGYSAPLVGPGPHVPIAFIDVRRPLASNQSRQDSCACKISWEALCFEKTVLSISSPVTPRSLLGPPVPTDASGLPRGVNRSFNEIFLEQHDSSSDAP